MGRQTNKQTNKRGGDESVNNTSNTCERRKRITRNDPKKYDITMKKKGAVLYEDKVLLHGQMFDLPESKEKLPYEEVMKDFRMRHPKLGKATRGWQPHGYATVRIWIDGGIVLDYNYDEHMAKIVKG